MQKIKPVAAVILAAGKGTRMKSDLPKCLHSVCGVPMVEHVGRALINVGVEEPIIVVGFGGQLLRDSLGSKYQYVEQNEQLGTAHATIMAQPLLEGLDGYVIVTPGDVPLLNQEVFSQLVARAADTEAQAVIGTCELEDPTGYGRIVRDKAGSVQKIVEHKDASDKVRAIKEINSAVYCFDVKALLKYLPQVTNENQQGEYYLTDVIEMMAKDQHKVETLVYKDFFVFQGVNNRWQLAESTAELRKRILIEHAMEGVTIVDPNTTFIGTDVHIGVDSVIHPFTSIEGATRIGSGCHIGPMSVVVESKIGDECIVLMSHVNRAEMADGSRCGPYAHLRPKAKIGARSKIGNFVEIKNSDLQENVSVGHLAYIGDAFVGAKTNVGAGTITCNYDGNVKSITTIGKDVFVGSNSTLVAPVTIEDEAFIAAGSVITESVKSGSLAIGRAKQVEKEKWVSQRRTKQQAKQEAKPE